MLRKGHDSSRLLKLGRLVLRADLHYSSAPLLSVPASRPVLLCAPWQNARPAASLYTCEVPDVRIRPVRKLHLSPRAGRLGHQHADTPPLAYKERKIVVNTCGPLYKIWRAEQRHGYKHAPEAGAEVCVDYVHTAMDRAEHKDHRKRPLALMLTGAPGSYNDFRHTIPFLDRHGVDILCPNWPDMKFTYQTNYWWHTSDEKACLVVDLLKQLDIKTIDMLVSHSTSSFPAVQLAADVPEVEVKSMALLMAAPHSHISVMKHPLLVNPVLHWLLKVPGMLRTLEPTIRMVMAMTRHPVKRRMNDVFFAYFSTIGVDNDRFHQQVTSLLKRRLPMVVMISDMDKIISVEDNKQLLLRIGCDPQKTWLYDGEGQLIRSGEPGVIKVIQLLKGSHYGFSRYSDICNKALLELLAQVPPYSNRFHS